VKLNMMKPSVNNMAARVFLRAANLEFTEDDVYGKTRTPEFLAKNPAHLTPMLEAKETISVPHHRPNTAPPNKVSRAAPGNDSAVTAT